MPSLTVNGATLHYEEHGSGTETLVFAHGLLCSNRMFDKQVESLKDRYRCITFDFRGQGQSEVTESGYDMDTLTLDALELIKALDCAPCHFLGLSMGGFVGMRLAIRHPSLLKSLILVDTTAETEPEENVPRYRMLNFLARWLSIRLVAGRVMKLLFGQKFLNDPKRAEERKTWHGHLVSNDRIGISRAVKAVIERKGVYQELHRITHPTLIIVGEQDVATPPEKAERMHRRIPHSKLAVIPGAGHTPTVEEPEEINRVLQDFLNSQG